MAWHKKGVVTALAELLIGEEFLKWLGSFAEDDKNRTSVKHFAMLFSITVAGVGALWIIFCRGVWVMEHETTVYFELAVLMIAASGASVGGYIFGKPSDRLPKPPKKPDEEKDDA